ncbi:hypothetical protein [Dactylosporangium sp. NPDC005555]|uniref:hypothetical protein n=1 Tax=Dactylosporangium sp. NPDC005555 TaxID=3154889 RepID=UPI0033A54D80
MRAPDDVADAVAALPSRWPAARAERWLRHIATGLARHGRHRWRWWEAVGSRPGLPSEGGGPGQAPAAVWLRRTPVGPGEAAGMFPVMWILLAALVTGLWFGAPPFTRWANRTLVDGSQLRYYEAIQGWLGEQVGRFTDLVGGTAAAIAVVSLVPAVGVTVEELFGWQAVPPAATSRGTLAQHRRAAGHRAAVLAGQALGIGAVVWLFVDVLLPTYRRLAAGAGTTVTAATPGYLWVGGAGLAAYLLFAGVRRPAGMPWLRFQVLRAVLALTRRAPWRIHRFLDDAVAAGILVAERGGYAFRDPGLVQRLWPERLRAPAGEGGGWLRAEGDRLAGEGEHAAALTRWRAAAALGDATAAVAAARLLSQQAMAASSPLRTVRTLRAAIRAWETAGTEAAGTEATGAEAAGTGAAVRQEAEGFYDDWPARPAARPVTFLRTALLRRLRPAPAEVATAAPAADDGLVPAPARYSEKARTALDAAARDVPDGGLLGTGRVLGALIQADAYGNWERVWPFDPESSRLVEAADLDGDDLGWQEWAGVPMTATLERALVWLGRLSREFGLRPIPPAALALALVRHPASGAARTIMRVNDITHDEVRRYVHDDLLIAEDAGIRDF